MAGDRLDMMKKRLLGMREELLDEARRHNAEAAELRDEGVPDIADQGLTDNLGEFLHLLGDARREEVLKIDEALERLGNGRYGLCQECGEEIDPQRLELRPHTRFCITCKQALEAFEGLRKGVGKTTL